MIIYLDTNIFIYLSDESSPYYKECRQLVTYCKANGVFIATSAETVQEIIYLAKNIKQTERGLEIAHLCLKLVDDLLSVSPLTIKQYLKEVEGYLTSSSRDLLHLSTCVENKIEVVITIDKDFKKFSQINSYTPKQYLEIVQDK